MVEVSQHDVKHAKGGASGIAMYTPADVHYGRTVALHQVRTSVLADAYVQHPERFVHGLPAPKPVPAEVWINRPIPLWNPPDQPGRTWGQFR